MEYPKTISIVSETDKKVGTFEMRPDLHNGRPAWDMQGSLHHSICWTPYDTNSEFGFWSLANLWSLDEDGQATGIVFETPENPIGDAPAGMPITATKSNMPPLGWWTRGRPWAGDRTSGGRQMKLVV